VGSGAEAENVKLMKSSEEDGRFYRVKSSTRADVSIFGASLYVGVKGAERKRRQTTLASAAISPRCTVSPEDSSIGADALHPSCSKIITDPLQHVAV
jgi:hypothetical protein